jgi:chemotaxis protein CheX
MSTEVLAGRVLTLRELEQCLERAMHEIANTMFNYDSKIIPLSDVEIVPPGLTAIVGFGGKISGFIAVHVCPECACVLASSLLGMAFDEVDDIVCDAMGEMVNMLAGGLKKFASQNEDLFKISVPSIIRGSDYTTQAPREAEQIAFGVQAGPRSFAIQLIVEMR